MDDSEPPDPSTQRLPLYPRPESKQDTFPTSTTPLLEPDATGRNNVAEEERGAAKEKGGEEKGERDRIWHHEEKTQHDPTESTEPVVTSPNFA
ncbi:hypothetical protein BLNAU_11469 [Blattamonas nauphoetae]|uniref:Uncharacterized protein n=1 Tax=Blattamonas nauphoetae TaxID=2049346 RepID=A0ABQ9XSK6_9EUKA|nr:hypothetical protein BLNAU_11469 [Blattamonas nauphoetae]